MRTIWRRFWTVARWVGAAVIGLFVLSLVAGSGWCAGQHVTLDNNLRSGNSTADVHVTAQPGQSVEAVVHVGESHSSEGSRPAWRANYQLCLDHFVYDVGQAPAGRCDHLQTK